MLVFANISFPSCPEGIALTPARDNTTSAGNLVEIQAERALNITSLSLNLNSGTSAINVYLNRDPLNETAFADSSAWTLLGNLTVNSPGPASVSGQLTSLGNDVLDIPMAEGERITLIVYQSNATSVRSTTSDNLGAIWHNAVNLRVFQGYEIAANGATPFNSTLSFPRGVNWRIFYTCL